MVEVGPSTAYWPMMVAWRRPWSGPEIQPRWILQQPTSIGEMPWKRDVQVGPKELRPRGIATTLRRPKAILGQNLDGRRLLMRDQSPTRPRPKRRFCAGNRRSRWDAEIPSCVGRQGVTAFQRRWPFPPRSIPPDCPAGFLSRGRANPKHDNHQKKLISVLPMAMPSRMPGFAFGDRQSLRVWYVES